MTASAAGADLDVGLYLVTAPRAHLDGTVAAAVAGGVTLVQLRDKTADTDELGRTARRLRSLTAAYGVPLVVDDDLTAAREADGIHVGIGDVPPAAAREVLGPAAVVGWSLEHLDQLDDRESLAACSYVAVSPTWATATKTDTAPPWGPAGVREVVQAVGDRLPVVGIGGIDATNAGEVIRAGADGVAVVSAICDSSDPGAASRALATAVRSAQAERTGADR